MLNSFKLSLQYILPKLWLTRLAGWGASKRAGWLTKLVIDLFVKYYKVDMKGAVAGGIRLLRLFHVDLVAVSYTHLDVYKRQKLRSANALTLLLYRSQSIV